MKIQQNPKMSQSEIPLWWERSNEDGNSFENCFWFFSLITRTTQNFSEKKIFSIKMWCFHKYFTDIEQKMEENLGIFGWLQERQNVNCFFKKDRYHGDWSPNLVGNTLE